MARVAREILAYLVRNPQAQDTLEGVAQWWLLDQAIVEETRYVKQALAELTSQGLLEEHVGTDARIHYRLNRQKQDEIARMRDPA